MGSITTTLFSWNFLIGFVLGVIVQRAYCHAQAKYLDRLHPYPDGRKHSVRGLNKTYVAYAICAIIIGLVTISTQKTYNITQDNIRDIKQLTADTQDCSRQFNAAIKARGDIAKEEASINARWQDIQFDRTSALNKLVGQFGSATNPAYIAAKQVIDQQYYEKTADLFKDLKEIAAKRAAPAYPEPTCGK